MTTAGQVRNAFPAFRIFVFGQEVTEDVLSVRVNYDDARAPNTAEFVLANKGQSDDGRGVEDRYIVTEYDIHALYDSVDVASVELPDLAARLTAIIENAELAAATSPLGFDLPATVQGLADFQSTVNATAEDYRTQTESTLSEIDRVIRERINRTIQDQVKRRVLGTKVRERVPVAQPDFTKTGTQKVGDPHGLTALRGEAFRYPFQVGDCIFHSNDPVRIFWRDPFNPRVWYHMFAGFVSDWVDDVDENNQKTVTIRVEDVTRILRYARITTNPGIFDIDQVQQVEDAVIRTFYNEDGLTDLTLPEMLYTVVFGSEAAGTTNLLKAGKGDRIQSPALKYRRLNASGVSTEDEIGGSGAGAFSFDRSAIFIFGLDEGVPPAPDAPPVPSQILQKEIKLNGANALAVYQAIVDHQVHATDLETMALIAKSTGQSYAVSRAGLIKDAKTGEPKIDEVIKTIGENPQWYPVDGGRLIMLVPASLGPNTNRDILLRDLVQGVATQTSFRTRLAMIFDILERIEFSFYASPRGDLLCEMPLYDFEPDDFGTSPVTKTDVLNAFRAGATGTAQTPEEFGIAFDVGDVRGPFAPHYHIAKRDTVRWQRSFTDEKVRTQFASPWYVVQGYKGIATSEAIGLGCAVSTLRPLVPQFGVRFERGEPSAFIATKEGAQVFCELKLNQWNADARSASTDAIPQLRLGPNRPLLFTERRYIGTTRSVQHALAWGAQGDMSMNLGTNYARGWDGQLKSGTQKPLYAPLGGFASRSLNFAVLFKRINPDSSTATPSTQQVGPSISGGVG